MVAIAKYLQISFNDIFEDTFSQFSLTVQSVAVLLLLKRERNAIVNILFQSKISKNCQSVLEVLDGY
jgi:hypothetical protein